MALTFADRPVWELTVDDVYRMLASGVLTEDTPVELLEGVLVEVSPKSPKHAWAVRLIDEWLLPTRNAKTHWVQVEQTLELTGSASLPEPDISVVELGFERSSHPTSAVLVVEVSVSSLGMDRDVKAPLYAAAGVPDYWIVDVDHRRLEVRRDPYDGGYRDVRVLGPDDTVTPLGLDLPPLELARIL